MDSLTQIVLGGAVGEAVLGKRVGNKAVLWGAIGGTIPDLDAVLGKFLNTVSYLDIHRGFSHSIVFAILIAPILGFLIHKIYKNKKETNSWGWTQLMFWSIFTHPLLDIFTTWGTRLFWPLDWRISLQSIFVIDPLYTIPFLFCLIMVLTLNKKSKSRRKWNKIGLIYSTSYLFLALIFKGYVNQQFEKQLKENNIEYVDFNSRPTPLNIVLWTFNIEKEDRFDIGYYGLFDSSKTLKLRSFPKNKELLNPYRNNKQVERLIFLTRGQYIIEKAENGIYMHDLRFGMLDSFDEKNKEWAFTYVIQSTKDGIKITEKEKSFKDSKAAMSNLWKRIWEG